MAPFPPRIHYQYKNNVLWLKEQKVKVGNSLLGNEDTLCLFLNFQNKCPTMPGGDQLVSDVQGQSELLFLSFSMLFNVVSVK